MDENFQVTGNIKRKIVIKHDLLIADEDSQLDCPLKR